MERLLLGGLATFVLASTGWGQDKSRYTIVVGANEFLSSGAAAIRAGEYDAGIRLTSMGLERDALDVLERAAGLANLCAAHVAKKEPDEAIPYCTESLRLNDSNWRPYSNRSHAYMLKGMYTEAAIDNDAAAAIAPHADHVLMIQGMLNELKLQPRVTLKEHP